MLLKLIHRQTRQNNTTVEYSRDEEQSNGREENRTMPSLRFSNLQITEKGFEDIDVDIDGDCTGHAIYEIKDSTSTVNISFEIDASSEVVEEVTVSNPHSPIDDLRLNDNSSVIDSCIFFSVYCRPFASNEYQVEYLSLDRMIDIIERTFSEDLQEYVDEVQEEHDEEDRRSRKENVGSTVDTWVE